MTACVVAVAVLAIILVSLDDWASDFYKPGELSTPHAQILAGTMTLQRCAACHPGTSDGGWFAWGGHAHEGVDQTSRCLDCHHTTIPAQTARLAHGVSQTQLASFIQQRQSPRLASTRRQDNSAGDLSQSLTWHDWMPGPEGSSDDVQCSACHREHHGPQGDLLSLSSQQCQTCHQDRFGGFATSHPQWNHWPYGRGGAIDFDHRSHITKHFPDTKQGGMSAVFNCQSCHPTTSDGELLRSVDYETACASCHQTALETQ
ncbi:MAG: hypothetical protein AAGA03_13150, partial [Planctomycetota bacterium]